MAKDITIVDPTPLYDKKIFILAVDGIPGATQTAIIRTYLGVDDAHLPLTDRLGAQLEAKAFSAGDAVLVQYNATDVRYELLNLRATTSVVAKELSNGASNAGYLTNNSGDALGNQETFVIPSGLRVGYGNSGSSGIMDLSGELRFGDGMFLQKRETVEGATTTNTNLIGEGLDAPEEVSFQIGSGYDTAFVYSGIFNAVMSDTAVATSYTDHVPFAKVNMIFNGVDSVITPTSPPAAWTDGDKFLFDIGGATGADGVYAKLLSGEVFDDAGTLKLLVKGVNVNGMPMPTETGHIAMLAKPGDNSFVIGNNTKRPGDNEIVLGSFIPNMHLITGWASGFGKISTDYDIDSRASAYFRGYVSCRRFSMNTVPSGFGPTVSITDSEVVFTNTLGNIELDCVDVEVTGTVDGRDIAADGIVLDGLVSGMIWQAAVNTFADLATTYPAAVEGWVASVNAEDVIYRYDGSAWIVIASGSVPLASAIVDGKMSSADFSKLASMTVIDEATLINKSTGITSWVSGNQNASDGGLYAPDLVAPGTLTLPPSPTAGEYVRVNDIYGVFGDTSLTLLRNGEKIMSLLEDMIVDTKHASFSLTYIDATIGWAITNN